MKEEHRELLRSVTLRLGALARGEAPVPIQVVDETDPVFEELRDTANALIESFNEARELIAGLAQGNLQLSVSRSNRLATPFKELQSSLRHLVWQTGRIAEGDYSQRVHFLGEFAESFNAMVESLAEKARVEESLRKANAEVKQLEGIIPICMYCKKIRNDSDYWEKLENYLTSRTDALFSHGICPECLQKHFNK